MTAKTRRAKIAKMMRRKAHQEQTRTSVPVESFHRPKVAAATIIAADGTRQVVESQVESDAETEALLLASLADATNGAGIFSEFKEMVEEPVVVQEDTDTYTDADIAEAQVHEPYADEPDEQTSINNGRGTCLYCGKREKVRKDGSMTKHGPADAPCAGTWKPAA